MHAFICCQRQWLPMQVHHLGFTCCSPPSGRGRFRQKERPHELTISTTDVKFAWPRFAAFMQLVDSTNTQPALQDKLYCPPHPWVYKETACKCLVVWRHPICPFITNFVEDHGIILPGRTSYVRHHGVKLLSYQSDSCSPTLWTYHADKGGTFLQHFRSCLESLVSNDNGSKNRSVLDVSTRHRKASKVSQWKSGSGRWGSLESCQDWAGVLQINCAAWGFRLQENGTMFTWWTLIVHHHRLSLGRKLPLGSWMFRRNSPQNERHPILDCDFFVCFMVHFWI